MPNSLTGKAPSTNFSTLFLSLSFVSSSSSSRSPRFSIPSEFNDLEMQDSSGLFFLDRNYCRLIEPIALIAIVEDSPLSSEPKHSFLAKSVNKFIVT